MRHKWSPEDDEALKKAVEIAHPLAKEMKGPRDVFWNAVVGILFSNRGIVVTAESARSRYRKLSQESTNSSDATWKKVAERVEEYEKSMLEAAYDDVQEIKRHMSELSKKVDSLLVLWT